MAENIVADAPLTVSNKILDRAQELLDQGGEAESHQAKVIALSNFLEEVFEIELNEILPGVERRINDQVLGVSGRIDLLYQGIVIEMKTDLDREYGEAEEKMREKYFPAIIEESSNDEYIGLITDMVEFTLVRPVTENGEVTGLSKIDSIDASNQNTQQTLFWLDAALFSGKVREPSADELQTKFGPGSPTYELAVEEIEGIWEQAQKQESAQLRLELWTRMMEIVYGDTPDEQAFASQTYLSILVKLLVRIRIDPTVPTERREFEEILTGDYFNHHGITNLVEDDFFTWVLEEPASEYAIELCQKLSRSLSLYDIDRADEDLFKEIYQEIIGVNQRHGTGEYYTPRWLCEFTLDDSLDYYGESASDFPRTLDPACGSGGFLTAAIYELLDRSEQLPNDEQLELVMNNIQGIDVNPLAVVIARANYAIALGDLIQTGKEITIPVFAADSIKLPTLQNSLQYGVQCYGIEVENRTLLIPKSIASNSQKRNRVLSALGESAHRYQDRLSEAEDEPLSREDKSLFRDQAGAFLEQNTPDSVGENEESVLQETLKDLLQFVDQNKDHIWIYLLNNFYAPIMLTEGGENLFDLVIGNPPWIVMRSIRNDSYQEFLKTSIKEYNLLDQSDINLYTHMEMATLFFRKAPDLYLRGDGQGRVSLIMPVSVTTGALHHKNFNEFDTPDMKLEMVHSFRKVSEIFSLPPCVLTAKLGETSDFPTHLSEWEGSLTNLRRNANWERVSQVLDSTEGEYSPAQIPTGESPYYDDVYEGATITPRNLYYIDFVQRGDLGISEDRPLVETSEDVARVAGKRWKEVRVRGRVEADFIHGSYLGKDLVPFGTLSPRPVVLPSVTDGGKRVLLDETSLRNQGQPLMADRLSEMESQWASHRTEKSVDRFPSIKDRLNYHDIFTKQDPTNRYITIYNGRGADSFATVIDRKELDDLQVGDATIEFSDFVVDSTNYAYETSSLDEAHYLCAVLNSHEIHAAVKPFQPEGAYGYRDIGRRPFKLPIPKFDDANGAHQNLIDLSQEAHQLVDSVDFTDQGFKTSRRLANEALEEEGIIDAIDSIVLSLGMAGALLTDGEN